MNLHAPFTFLKTVSGIAVGETRDDSKEFEYDHSYWSVDTSDNHFISQEQVLHNALFSIMSLLKSHNAGIQRSWNYCNRISISGLQCLCVCLWTNWIRENIHYDGNWGCVVYCYVYRNSLLITLQEDPGLVPRICQVSSFHAYCKPVLNVLPIHTHTLCLG